MESGRKRECANYFEYLDYVARKLFTLSQKSFDKLRQIHQTFNPSSKSIITKFRLSNGRTLFGVCVCVCVQLFGL